MEDLTIESCARWADFDPDNPSRLVSDMDEAVGREMVGKMTGGDIVDSYNEYAEKNNYGQFYPKDSFSEIESKISDAIETVRDEVRDVVFDPNPDNAELFTRDGYSKIVFLDYSDAEERICADTMFLRWLATDGGNTVSGDAEEIYDFYTENKDAILAKAKEEK